MTKHERFDWDVGKGAQNLRKHGVSFEAAAVVLSDPFFEIFHDEEFDEKHSDEAEDRWITYGSDPFDRSIVLQIVWTPRFDVEGIETRLVSARYATPRERRRYEQRFQDRG